MHGGFDALRKAIDMGPEAVIREVTDAKLLGRGGAAFPTGRKWDAVAKQPVAHTLARAIFGGGRGGGLAGAAG